MSVAGMCPRLVSGCYTQLEALFLYALAKAARQVRERRRETVRGRRRGADGWQWVVSRGGFGIVVPDDQLAMLGRCLSDGHEDCAWAYAVALEMLTKLVMDHRQRAPETHGNTCWGGGEGEIKKERFFIAPGSKGKVSLESAQDG